MEFSESATAMEELYSNQVPDKYKLDPVIKYKEDYPQEDFINFLNGIDSDNTGNKYLLIIGDETKIPSLDVSGDNGYDQVCSNQQPSDAFFNTNFAKKLSQKESDAIAMGIGYDDGSGFSHFPSTHIYNTPGVKEIKIICKVVLGKS